MNNETVTETKRTWIGILGVVVILGVPLTGYLAHENAQVQVTSAEVEELRSEMVTGRVQMQTMSNQLSAISQKLSDIADTLRAHK